MSIDCKAAVRATLIGDPEMAAGLSAWSGDPSVFTRRPIPQDVTQPFTIVNSPSSITDEDGLTSDRPVVMLDVATYGRKSAPGSADDQTRLVERLGARVRELFHRNRFSVSPTGFSTIDVRAAGPIDAPVDDDVTVGRLVTLTIRLRRIP